MALVGGQPARCRVCGGPAHPRVHLVDPIDLGIAPRRRDDEIPPPSVAISFVAPWRRRLGTAKDTTNAR